MKILVFGCGAIGTIYGYLLAEAGNEVIHFVRESRAGQLAEGIAISLLDGRDGKNIKEIRDSYKLRTITAFEKQEAYDLILVSVKHGSLDGALEILKNNPVTGDILFFNGLWEDYSHLDGFLDRSRYLWGYPVAGGNIDYNLRKLEGAVLDHIILGEIDGSITDRYNKIEKIFSGAGIKAEAPRNVLHWIWVHMAINAGIISTAMKYGSAAAFMDSAKALREGINTVRETLRIAEARGVSLEDYRDEVRLFHMPPVIAGTLFKFFFRTNVLSRRIMELHNNPEDLYELCSDVYNTGMQLKISTPLFEEKKEYFLNKI